MPMSYSYEPNNVKEYGKDRMRFELGDTMVEGGSDTTALTDEEIQAALETYPNSWKRAKLMLIESLFRRFSYEVTTKTGPLTLEMQGRANLWKEEYEKLKKEVKLETISVPNDISATYKAERKPPYFYTGMQQNEGTRE